MANVAVVRIRHADGRVEERWLPAGRFDVGREAGDIVLACDTRVSALHAVLLVKPGQVTITDAGSRNGIFDSNGVRSFAPLRLLAGQPVQLGSSSITLARLLPVSGRTELDGAQAGQSSGLPAQGSSSAETPSLTKRRHQEALADLRFWRGLVHVVGVAFAVAIVVATALLLRGGEAGGDSFARLLSGTTAIASGGALAWLLKRRDEAIAAERASFRDAALGTLAIGVIEQAARQRPDGSAWRLFRRLPLIVQLLLGVYGWWALLPLWLWDQRVQRTPNR